MSKANLLETYLEGTGSTYAGYTLQSVLTLSDIEMEQCHDFIQWSFPLPEPSSVHGEAPTATPAELAGFSEEAKKGSYLLFLRFLKFLGLKLGRKEKTFKEKLLFWKPFNPVFIGQAENFEARRQDWLDFHTHNDLRISRILRSMLLQGYTQEVQSFYTWLALNCDRQVALGYWHRASQSA